MFVFAKLFDCNCLELTSNSNLKTIPDRFQNVQIFKRVSYLEIFLIILYLYESLTGILQHHVICVKYEEFKVKEVSFLY